ncbi:MULTISPECIES: PadR family transcriptional regulator [Streptacidiphilus]|uniref:PadR family transcriptional regulator n=1 Tax=Streptacidiphilus cavernicola TaxID=3342716 RepID=A0ABV6UJV2_9ACTN|nr:helix-turn-helix transcriptional regulator [Streptacidiphilus jeojiense]
MSLPHAILTALLERPSSGLELTRRFDRSIGYFWSATHQQIYRELGKLEQGGLIEAVPQPPSRGQRKEYRVLPDGRAELVRWVAEGQDPKPVRDPLLLRLRAAAVVGTAGLDVELQRHLAEHRRQLDEYLEIEQRDFPADGSGGGDRLHHLVLKAGIALETFWVQWLAEAVGELAGEPAAEEVAEPGKPGIAG